VVEKVALVQFFLLFLLFSPVNIIPPWLSALISTLLLLFIEFNSLQKDCGIRLTPGKDRSLTWLSLMVLLINTNIFL
jgi:hypothetical protein